MHLSKQGIGRDRRGGQKKQHRSTKKKNRHPRPFSGICRRDDTSTPQGLLVPLSGTAMFVQLPKGTHWPAPLRGFAISVLCTPSTLPRSGPNFPSTALQFRRVRLEAHILWAKQVPSVATPRQNYWGLLCSFTNGSSTATIFSCCLRGS